MASRIERLEHLIARYARLLPFWRRELTEAKRHKKAGRHVAPERPLPIYGVDYAWGRPKMGDLRTAHIGFAGRYLTEPGKRAGEGKTLSRAEAKLLSSSGIDCFAIYEEGGEAMRAGAAQGRIDARRALTAAMAIGIPRGRPIYFACDFDAAGVLPLVLAYMHAAKAILRPHYYAGIYGGIAEVRAALNGGFHYAFQTEAWSRGEWDPRAQLRQLGEVTIDGVDCDRDYAHAADFGQWRI